MATDLRLSSCLKEATADKLAAMPPKIRRTAFRSNLVRLIAHTALGGLIASFAGCAASNSHFVEKKGDSYYYDQHTPGPDPEHIVDNVPEPVGGMRSFTSHLDYPRELRRRRITGVVRVRVKMDAKGHIVSAQIVQRVHPILDNIVLQAVLNTKWTPATRGGKAVPFTFRLPITFSL